MYFYFHLLNKEKSYSIDKYLPDLIPSLTNVNQTKLLFQTKKYMYGWDGMKV